MDYQDRKFLEEPTAGSSSMIYAFQGNMKFKSVYTSTEAIARETFLRISDCHNTIHLHMVNEDKAAFIKKLKLIEETCYNFINALEDEL